MKTPAFLPAFGNKPKHIIGRDGITSEFLDGLSQPIGHRNRATFLIGQRGTGKTTLLLEFEEFAISAGYVPVRVTASENMLDEIIHTVQTAGAEHVGSRKRRIKGFTAGVAGFTFGLTFTDEVETRYGFRIKLGMLCDELSKHGKGILILVDEIQSSSAAIRTLATTYQHFVGDERNIAIAMAGLPTSISIVLNDDVLTFLNRAHKVRLEPLLLAEVSAGYANEFARQGRTIDSSVLNLIVPATKGYPYLYQLIGYHVLKFANDGQEISSEIAERAIDASRWDMVENVFSPVLKPLSEKDIEFLKAMSIDEETSSVAEIQGRLESSKGHVSVYRSRLIDAGIIAPSGHGELEIVVPYLGDYLRGNF